MEERRSGEEEKKGRGEKDKRIRGEIREEEPDEQRRKMRRGITREEE